MAGEMTVTEIETELAAVRAARLEIINTKEIQGSQGGRQTTRHTMSSLEYLNAQEKYLMGLLQGLDADGNSKGIRPRYGVFR